MKPNIFTLSFFITPHHTLLLIPAHNPPPRSFTPAPHNPAPHHFTAPAPAHHNSHPLPTALTPYTSLSLPCSSQLRPTTLQLSPPPLPCSLPCSSQPRPLPCSYHPHHFTAPAPILTARHLHPTALYLHLANPTPTPYSPQSQPFPCSLPCSSQLSPTTSHPLTPNTSLSLPCSLQPRPLPCSFTPTPYSLHS
ncbi:hypothetical protein HMPREF1860_01038 [Prevotella amnii]|uniref:Uncharacterized protein n=1 Tax=Prevotella amnii TaxID=419005 RepID=A0A134BDH2_9BACT|nr:hypothetical protein HMPREF1860_01038 [Prevotella amnii]